MFVQGDKFNVLRDWFPGDPALTEYGSTQRSEEFPFLACKIVRAFASYYDVFLLFGSGTVPG
jgi:hypothetical protein